MPRAGTPLGAPQHSLAREAGALERTLLRHVLDVGRGLDALDRVGRWKVTRDEIADGRRSRTRDSGSRRANHCTETRGT